MRAVGRIALVVLGAAAAVYGAALLAGRAGTPVWWPAAPEAVAPEFTRNVAWTQTGRVRPEIVARDTWIARGLVGVGAAAAAVGAWPRRRRGPGLA
ncbi:MAG: hypothetical protein JNM10_12270 [Planctomycetia bacterium]|nr:hypothetical protein [Planctomycetia bacterium]